MANWSLLALVSALVGYDADVIGILRYQAIRYNVGTTGLWSDAMQGLLIVAFLLYTACAVLFVLHKYADLAWNVPVAIVVIVFMLAAAALLIAGVGVYEDKRNKDTWVPDPYAGVLEISAALCAILVVIFQILQLATGSSSGPADA